VPRAYPEPGSQTKLIQYAPEPRRVFEIPKPSEAFNVFVVRPPSWTTSSTTIAFEPAAVKIATPLSPSFPSHRAECEPDRQPMPPRRENQQAQARATQLERRDLPILHAALPWTFVRQERMLML
jgi:hypothetical protein